MKNTVFKELFVSVTLRPWNSHDHETSDSMKANNMPLHWRNLSKNEVKVTNNQFLKN